MWSSEPIPLFAVLIVLPNEETNKGPAQLLRTLRWIILPLTRLMTPWRIPSLLTSPLPMAKERALRLSQKTTHRCILLKVQVTNPLFTYLPQPPQQHIPFFIRNNRFLFSRSPTYGGMLGQVSPFLSDHPRDKAVQATLMVEQQSQSACSRKRRAIKITLTYNK